MMSSSIAEIKVRSTGNGDAHVSCISGIGITFKDGRTSYFGSLDGTEHVVQLGGNEWITTIDVSWTKIRDGKPQFIESLAFHSNTGTKHGPFGHRLGRLASGLVSEKKTVRVSPSEKSYMLAGIYGYADTCLVGIGFQFLCVDGSGPPITSRIFGDRESGENVFFDERHRQGGMSKAERVACSGIGAAAVCSSPLACAGTGHLIAAGVEAAGYSMGAAGVAVGLVPCALAAGGAVLFVGGALMFYPWRKSSEEGEPKTWREAACSATDAGKKGAVAGAVAGGTLAALYGASAVVAAAEGAGVGQGAAAAAAGAAGMGRRRREENEDDDDEERGARNGQRDDCEGAAAAAAGAAGMGRRRREENKDDGNEEGGARNGQRDARGEIERARRRFKEQADKSEKINTSLPGSNSRLREQEKFVNDLAKEQEKHDAALETLTQRGRPRDLDKVLQKPESFEALGARRPNKKPGEPESKRPSSVLGSIKRNTTSIVSDIDSLLESI